MMDLQYRREFRDAVLYVFALGVEAGEARLVQRIASKGTALCSLLGDLTKVDDEEILTCAKLDAPPIDEPLEVRRLLQRGPVSDPRGWAEPASEPEEVGDKLAAELKAFERLRSQLLRTHRGRFVAIHNGALIDDDEDDFELAARVERLARRVGPIAICRVFELEKTHRSPEADPWFESPMPEEFGR